MNHRATRGVRVLIAAVAVVGATACGATRRGGNAPAPAVLFFSNESQDQADVYAVVSGQRVRIGTVFSNRMDTLMVPGNVAARGTNINVVARLLARNFAPSTGPLAIHPGDRLSVRLPADQRQLVVLPGDR